MPRYVFYSPLSLDAKAVTAAKRTATLLGATVVRSAAGQMLLEAPPARLVQLTAALPAWRYSVEGKSARIPERAIRPLQRARLATAKG